MSSSTVFVGCRLRHGINIDGERVAGYFVNPSDPDFQRPPANSARGFAFTEIPRRAWDAWFKANEDGELVKNKFVIAADTLAEAQALARTCGRLVPLTPIFN